LSTHPIAGTAKDTTEADSNFDAITYRKGAATLKQLYFRTGKATFKKAISAYFNKYAY
jgi:aminopeptidase N